jgi:hypothetical protein
MRRLAAARPKLIGLGRIAHQISYKPALETGVILIQLLAMPAVFKTVAANGEFGGISWALSYFPGSR